ncbi:MAG: CaiB/BaiF CoA-transferase family protein [Pseudomonadota bacterium]
MSGPLAGLKVVEFAGLGPAPLAGQFLADLGAEVTLIDRRSGKADPNAVNNRGKTSVALNLKAPEGVEAARRLIAAADILIEGFRPGVMERMGLGPDECLAKNPGLVYGRMTGWGQTGPMAQMAGHDINYLSLTGLLNAIGPDDQPPVAPINIAADYGGGTMFLLLGLLSGIISRQTTGKGQVIDAAMTEGASALMAMIHGLMGSGRWVNERFNNFLDGAAPFYRTYETSDGKYFSVGCLEPQFHKEFLRLSGLPGEHQQDYMNKAKWAERRTEYAALFATKTRDEWTAVFDGSDACAAPIMDWAEAPAHPQMAAREAFVTIGGVPQPAPAPRFSGTPAETPKPPSPPGADTDKVLAELGYSAEEIAALRAAGALT